MEVRSASSATLPVTLGLHDLPSGLSSNLLYARSGDREAAVRLYAQLPALLGGSIPNLVRQQLREGDDLVHDVYLIATDPRTPFQYHGDRETAAWLKRIAANVGLHLVRKRHREDDAVEQLGSHVAQPAVSTTQVDLQLDVSVVMAEAVRTLTERQRYVLAGRIRGMTYAQIGASFGITAQRVEQMWVDTKRRLRKCVRERYPNYYEITAQHLAEEADQ